MPYKLFLTALLLLPITAPTHASLTDINARSLTEHLVAQLMFNAEAPGEAYAIYVMGSDDPKTIKRSAIVTGVGNAWVFLRSALITPHCLTLAIDQNHTEGKYGQAQHASLALSFIANMGMGIHSLLHDIEKYKSLVGIFSPRR